MNLWIHELEKIRISKSSRDLLSKFFKVGSRATKAAIFSVEAIIKILPLEIAEMNNSLKLKLHSDFRWIFQSIKVEIYSCEVYPIHSSIPSENIHSKI